VHCEQLPYTVSVSDMEMDWGEQLLHRVSDVEMDRWLNRYFIQCSGRGRRMKSVMEMDIEVIL